ncbi:hypothetical protein [Marinilactibacillus sp. Marseille-P9653]|uniref:hypothetical protein n=1 Tax=Marinilactibacillus sp. Marseille-P9653 TaxID=2866583 RepID=UPI001CE436DE|nr:hypothetical protein [Marinilactibacillus sp. Marseille-P9653]
MTPIISLMDAYMIETLLAKGVEKETLKQAIQEHTAEQFKKIDNSFDYAELNQAVIGKEDLYQEAVENGYAISYLTIVGLKNLLRMKFGFEEDADYKAYERKIENLIVTPTELKALTKLVGKIWTVKETNRTDANSIEVSVLHISLSENL